MTIISLVRLQNASGSHAEHAVQTAVVIMAGSDDVKWAMWSNFGDIIRPHPPKISEGGGTWQPGAAGVQGALTGS